ncbi:NUDIX domain-containing protein [Streptomyces sp. NPDC102282]|uniref:NUDIX domain-containing protein n=1 Tax=Streptomyces sp. NPDC102282 TaxID=3366154 RepID=UPI0037FB1C3C
MTDNPETIRYTADVVCLRGDYVLVIRRGWDPYKDELALPGGHVDEGETSRVAGARELLEETGIRVAAEDLERLDVYDRPDRDPRGRYVSVAYVVRVPEGTVAQAGDDATAVQWVPLAAPGTLAFDHAEILDDARRHQLTASPGRC